MPSINFYLKNKRAKRSTLIFLYFSFQGKRLKLSTEVNVPPDKWNARKQRVKPSFSGALEINQYLDHLQAKIFESFIQLKKEQGIVDEDALKKHFSEKVGLGKKGVDSQKDTSFYDFFNSFVEEGKLTKARSTITKYTSVLSSLKAYEKKKGVELQFSNINLDFYSDFKKYILKERNYSVNYFGSLVRVLKTVLNEATERGINTNLAYQSKKFTTVQEEIDSIYLSTEELDKIRKLDLEGEVRRARDLFLLGCYTGLRYSDFSSLHTENIKGDFIKVRTRKTDEVVVIPIHNYVRQILDDYTQGGILKLKGMPNQVLNRHLKVIGEKAGITQDIITHNSRGGKRSSETRKKYELITTHTARRSFATNAFLAGLPTLSIMKITGHRTERAFMKYIKISQLDNAEKMKGHEFFKK